MEAVYLDGVSPEENRNFTGLAKHAPELELRATIQPKMRVLPRNHEGKMLALGQKAAWFTQSPYFVNVVEGAGWYGFDGIRKMAELMIRAYKEEKEVEDLVVQKRMGDAKAAYETDIQNYTNLHGGCVGCLFCTL